MEVNKKIILSVFTIGFLAISACASTWAYFQDTVTSLGNGFQTGSMELWVDFMPATPDGHAIVSGNLITNAIPEEQIGHGYIPQHPIKTIQIQNFGTVKGKLYVQCRPTVETLGNGSGIVIKLYDGGLPGILYNNGVNLAPNPVPVVDIPPGGEAVPLSLIYSFSDTKMNQNTYENKELKFDLIFTLKPSN